MRVPDVPFDLQTWQDKVQCASTMWSKVVLHIHQRHNTIPLLLRAVMVL